MDRGHFGGCGSSRGPVLIAVRKETSRAIEIQNFGHLDFSGCGSYRGPGSYRSPVLIGAPNLYSKTVSDINDGNTSVVQTLIGTDPKEKENV